MEWREFSTNSYPIGSNKKIAIKERTGNTSFDQVCLKFDGYFWDEADELAEFQINEGSLVETGITLLDYTANDIASNYVRRWGQRMANRESVSGYK